MNTKLKIILGTMVIATGFAAGGCGDDGGTPNTTATSNTSSTSDGGAGGDGTGGDGTGGDGTGGDGTGGDGGAAPTLLTCAQYCTQVNANCADGNKQYDGDAATLCEATCANFADGTVADMSGDTRGCRAYHSGAPAMDNATLHCPHGGPYGNVVCSEAGGSQCDVFCGLMQVICTGGNEQYADEAACLTECDALSDAETAFVAAAGEASDTFQCRGYHLTAAADNPGTHCEHAAGKAVCVP